MFPTKILAPNAAIGDTLKILDDIHVTTKNIAVYQRDIKPLLHKLEQIKEQNFECRATGTVAEITLALNDYFAREQKEYYPLMEDIVMLLEQFEQLTKANGFRILLANVSTNMCRLFHTDINDLRLLCTYYGQGTLWLPDEAVNPKAFLRRGNKENIVLDKNLVQQADAGDVLILKGGLYPGKPNPILHRSPSIEKQGENRLLLRIDTNANQKLWS